MFLNPTLPVTGLLLLLVTNPQVICQSFFSKLQSVGTESWTQSKSEKEGNLFHRGSGR